MGHLFYTTLSFVHHFESISEFQLSYSLKKLESGQNWQFFVLCDLEFWWMSLKNYRATLPYHTKFVHHFKAIDEFKLELQSGNFQFGSKSVFRVILKFDDWSWKTIGHLFYATSKYVHHFIAISEFKPKLQPGKTQFGWKLTNFLAVWPWNLTNDFQKQ